MDLAIRPLHPLFVAEVKGVDLSRDIDLATQRAIEHAMDEYAVCVLPEQKLDDERQIAFSRRYGPLENASAVKAQRKAGVIGKRVRHPEIFDVSNLDENGSIMAANDDRWLYRQANELWHSDSSFGKNRRLGRCCTRASCRPRAAIPISPTRAPPTTLCLRR